MLQDEALRRPLPALRSTITPTIDGDLSDPCWKSAALAERFYDRMNGGTNTDQTIVRIIYDESAIYVAFSCKDSQPEKIVAREQVPNSRFAGEEGIEDWVDLRLNPFHTNRYDEFSIFSINPRSSVVQQMLKSRGTRPISLPSNNRTGSMPR